MACPDMRLDEILESWVVWKLSLKWGFLSPTAWSSNSSKWNTKLPPLQESGFDWAIGMLGAYLICFSLRNLCLVPGSKIGLELASWSLRSQYFSSIADDLNLLGEFVQSSFSNLISGLLNIQPQEPFLWWSAGYCFLDASINALGYPPNISFFISLTLFSCV